VPRDAPGGTARAHAGTEVRRAREVEDLASIAHPIARAGPPGGRERRGGRGRLDTAPPGARPAPESGGQHDRGAVICPIGVASVSATGAPLPSLAAVKEKITLSSKKKKSPRSWRCATRNDRGFRFRGGNPRLSYPHRGSRRLGEPAWSLFWGGAVADVRGVPGAAGRAS
jgi:hypothetical protein